MLNIISALSSLHYSLSTSIPLQPLSAGRDILLFASKPDTGVAATDAFKPKSPTTNQTQGVASGGTSRSESPVLVHRTSSLPPAEHPNPRAVDPDRRVLPWSSTVVGDPKPTHQRDGSSPEQGREGTLSSSRAPSRAHQQYQRPRGSSIDSAQPLLPPTQGTASVQSSPRARNVLLKKTSLNRRNSLTNSSRHQSLPPRSRQTSDAGLGENVRREVEGRSSRAGTGNGGGSNGNAESWLVVNPPARIGHVGLTMYPDPSSQPGQGQRQVDECQSIPGPQITALPLPSTQQSHSNSRTSSEADVYETPGEVIQTATRSPPRLPPRPFAQEPGHPSPPKDSHIPLPVNLPLGNPIAREDTSVVSSIPTYLPIQDSRSPNRLHRPEHVDIGIPSVHGSLGYIPSMMSQAPSVISHDPMPGAGARHGHGHGDAQGQLGDTEAEGQGGYEGTKPLMPGGRAMEDRKGKGKEGARRVWDEDRGVWVEGVAAHGTGNGAASGNAADGPGSARTKVSLSQ